MQPSAERVAEVKQDVMLALSGLAVLDMDVFGATLKKYGYEMANAADEMPRQTEFVIALARLVTTGLAPLLVALVNKQPPTDRDVSEFFERYRVIDGLWAAARKPDGE